MEICLTFILVVVALSASNILLLLVNQSKISKILNFGEVLSFTVLLIGVVNLAFLCAFNLKKLTAYNRTTVCSSRF